jgi:hypothetical protein
MWAQSALVEQGAHTPAVHSDAAAVEQCEFDRHSTQTFVSMSQRDFSPLQSEFRVHSTQTFADMSQARFAPVQWVLAVHSTHVSVATLQMVVVPPHAPSHGRLPPLPASLPPSPAAPALG